MHVGAGRQTSVQRTARRRIRTCWRAYMLLKKMVGECTSVQLDRLLSKTLAASEANSSRLVAVVSVLALVLSYEVSQLFLCALHALVNLG